MAYINGRKVCLFSAKAGALRPSGGDGTAGLKYSLLTTSGSYSCIGIGTASGWDIRIASALSGHPVTSIGIEAFFNCTQISRLTIPENITRIEEGAFYGCDMSSVYLPKSLQFVGESAFGDGQSHLSDVYYAGSEEEWEAIWIGEYNEILTGTTIHYNYPVPEPEEVEEIEQLNAPIIKHEDDVLKICNIDDKADTLTIYADGEAKAVLPACAVVFDLATLGLAGGTHSITVTACAYWYAESDKSNAVSYAEATKGLLYILSDDGSFYICEGAGSFETLTDVVIANSIDGIPVTTIGVDAFCENTEVASIVIPDNVITIEDYAFFSCYNLERVRIGKGVKHIGTLAFDDCAITDVYYAGTSAEWASIEIGENNRSLLGATIHYNYTA